MGELIKLEASHGRRYVVETGVLDDRALLAFAMGHCHSMAIALQAEMGGEFVGLTQLQTPYDHILVALDETTVVDVGGARTPDEVLAAGGKFVPVSQADIDDLPNHGWMPAQPDIAATFVPAVIAHVDTGKPHRKPRCFSRNFVLGDLLEMHIEWSRVDTGDRLTAFGRLPGDRSGRWTRCAVMSIKAGQAR